MAADQSHDERPGRPECVGIDGNGLELLFRAVLSGSLDEACELIVSLTEDTRTDLADMCVVILRVELMLKSGVEPASAACRCKDMWRALKPSRGTGESLGGVDGGKGDDD